MNRVDVLDHGYVRLVDSMGSDLTVANAARVSFDKESDWDEMPAQGKAAGTLPEADERILRFLAKDYIKIDDLVEVVDYFQPGAKLRDRPGMDVRVGNYRPPSGGSS